MPEHRHRNTRPLKHTPCSPAGGSCLRRRIGRFAGFAALALLVLLLVPTGFNFALTQYEWANTQPYGQRVPVVGIDVTVPAFAADQGDAPAADGGGIPWARLATSTGLLRWVLLVAPDLALPEDTAHTDDERERIHRMTVWNYGNATVTDETQRLGDNARRLEGVGFPSDLPVLMLLAQDTVDEVPEWLTSHEEQLRGVRDHELAVLDGGHYLHWPRAPDIAATSADFLAERGIEPREEDELAASATAG